MVNIFLKSMFAFLCFLGSMLFLEETAKAQGWEPLQKISYGQGRFTINPAPKTPSLKSSWVERFRGTLLPTKTSPRPTSPVDSLGSTCQELNLCFSNIGIVISMLTTLPVHLVFLFGNLFAVYNKSPLFKKVWGILGTIFSVLAMTWGFIWFGGDLGTTCNGGISQGSIVGHIGLGILGLATLGLSIFNIVISEQLGNPKTLPISLVPTFSSSATEGTRVGLAWVGTF